MMIIRAALVCLVLVLLVGCGGRSSLPLVSVDPSSLGQPEIRREFRGVWVATVVNIDWPSEPGLESDQQRAEAIEILDTIARTNLNAVVLQIRPTADALYRSRLEPTSEFLTGKQGAAIDYDPLEFWIEEAHARGIDVHAWLNPFRARHPGTKGDDAPTHVSTTLADAVREYRGHLWLDPGEPTAREHSLRVIEDVVRRYDIDAVHLDDYFYPYPDDNPFPDEASYAKYQESGGELGRDDWRRDNINRFMRAMHERVRKIRPEVLIGISPFGIYRPGYPEGIQGFDQYARLYADARKWLRAGWLDYIAPQLYWAVESPGQPFQPLLEWWVQESWAGKHVWPGLYLTRIEADGGWSPEEIVRQVRIVRDNERSGGAIHFSMVGIQQNRQGVAERLREQVYTEPAVPPATPWRVGSTPAPAQVWARHEQGQSVRLTWRTSDRSAEPARWVVQTLQGGAWTTRVFGGGIRHLVLEEPSSEQALQAVVITPVSRLGRMGRPTARVRGESPEID